MKLLMFFTVDEQHPSRCPLKDAAVDDQQTVRAALVGVGSALVVIWRLHAVQLHDSWKTSATGQDEKAELSVERRSPRRGLTGVGQLQRVVGCLRVGGRHVDPKGDAFSSTEKHRQSG